MRSAQAAAKPPEGGLVHEKFAPPAVNGWATESKELTVQPRRILVVADGPISDLIRQALEQRRFDIRATDSLVNARRKLFESQLDLVLIDLEVAQAAEFIRQVRNISSLRGTSVLAIGKWGSGQPTIALAAGADAYEPAPIDPERLVDAVQRVLHKRAAAVGMND